MPFLRAGETLDATFSRDRVPLATRVRASLIMSSRAMVRERGFFPRSRRRSARPSTRSRRAGCRCR